MRNTRAMGVAAVAAAALTGLMTGVLPASGQDSGRTELNLDAKLVTFHKVDVKPKKDSAGDIFQFTDVLSKDGAKTGGDGASCVHTTRTYYECDWTITLKDGTFQMQGIGRDVNSGYTLAIVGGTGAYFGARGEMLVTDALKKVAHYKLTYTL